MKVSITYERREIVMVRRGQPERCGGSCPQCNGALISLDTAVTSIATDTRTVLGMIERGSIHSVDTARGHLRVCRMSLEIFSNGEME